MENEEPRQVEIELNTITHALAGDEAALARIYDAYARPIYRYHYSRVGNAPDAEDLTSQTFMAMLDALPRFQRKADLIKRLSLPQSPNRSDPHACR